MMDSIIELRNELHENAEPSLRETNTKKILLAFIRNHTNLEVRDCGLWFYAVYRADSNAKNIAFRADFDAVMCSDGKARHLCGHDGHSACLAGAAIRIEQTAPHINVYFIFQPAEETGEGAVLCCELFEKCRIDAIYGFHNIPSFAEKEVLLLPHTFACASTGMEISLTGRQSHAAYPEQGYNPAVAISRLVLYMDSLLKKPHDGIVLGTVIGIETGSTAYGVSAGEGVLRLTLRAEHQKEYDDLCDSIAAYAMQTAAEEKLLCSIRKTEEFPATVNDAGSTEKVRKAAEHLGLSVRYPEEPFRWSEDFGHYLLHTKGAFFGVGCGTEYAGLHTEHYCFQDSIIETVIRLFTEIVLQEENETAWDSCSGLNSQNL